MEASIAGTVPLTFYPTLLMLTGLPVRRDHVTYCGQLNALEAFAWLEVYVLHEF